MRGSIGRSAKAAFVVVALAAGTMAAPTRAAALDDFSGSFVDTVIQISFVKVGPRVQYMYLGNVADTRHDLQVGERFVAGQTIAFSVFERRDYRVSFWGAGEALSVKSREPLDEPAGKGFRLTYEDGTVVEIIA